MRNKFFLIVSCVTILNSTPIAGQIRQPSKNVTVTTTPRGMNSSPVNSLSADAFWRKYTVRNDGPSHVTVAYTKYSRGEMIHSAHISQIVGKGDVVFESVLDRNIPKLIQYMSVLPGGACAAAGLNFNTSEKIQYIVCDGDPVGINGPVPMFLIYTEDGDAILKHFSPHMKEEVLPSGKLTKYADKVKEEIYEYYIITYEAK